MSSGIGAGGGLSGSALATVWTGPTPAGVGFAGGARLAGALGAAFALGGAGGETPLQAARRSDASTQRNIVDGPVYAQIRILDKTC